MCFDKKFKKLISGNSFLKKDISSSSDLSNNPFILSFGSGLLITFMSLDYFKIFNSLLTALLTAVCILLTETS